MSSWPAGCRALKEMMFVAISTDRHCGYCEAAHIACCKMLGVDQAGIAALLENLDATQLDHDDMFSNYG